MKKILLIIILLTFNNTSYAEQTELINFCDYNTIDSYKEQKKFRIRPFISSYYKKATKYLEEEEVKKSEEVLNKMLMKNLTPYEKTIVNQTLAFISLQNSEIEKAIVYYEEALKNNGLVFNEKIIFMLKISQVYFTYHEIEKGYNLLKLLSKTIEESNCTISKNIENYKKVNKSINKDFNNFSKIDYEWLILKEDISDKAVSLRTTYTPAYPLSASRYGFEGWVILQFDVNELGVPINIKAIDRDPKNKIFLKESIRAMKKWRYNPAIKNGKPILVKNKKHRFDFKLEEK